MFIVADAQTLGEGLGGPRFVEHGASGRASGLFTLPDEGARSAKRPGWSVAGGGPNDHAAVEGGGAGQSAQPPLFERHRERIAR